MVVLTYSDARAYCLGIAQIIPVLMIALFVIDSSRFVQTAESTRKQAQKAVDIVSTSLPDVQQKAAQAVNLGIEQIDSQKTRASELEPCCPRCPVGNELINTLVAAGWSAAVTSSPRRVRCTI